MRFLLAVLLIFAACAPAQADPPAVVHVRTVSVPSPALAAADGAAGVQIGVWVDGLHQAQLAQWYEAASRPPPRTANVSTKARPSHHCGADCSTPPAGSSSSGDCANPVVSEATAFRESRCRWDAYNAAGCSGRGCIGFYQLDRGHFDKQSPWNPSAHGTCYGLDPSTHEGQTECASRLGPSAWGG